LLRTPVTQYRAFVLGTGRIEERRWVPAHQGKHPGAGGRYREGGLT
jgi:hypothetical protein